MAADVETLLCVIARLTGMSEDYVRLLYGYEKVTK